MSIENSNASRDCHSVSFLGHTCLSTNRDAQAFDLLQVQVVPAISGKFVGHLLSSVRCYVPHCPDWPSATPGRPCTFHPEWSRTITLAIGDRGHGTLKKLRSQGKRRLWTCPCPAPACGRRRRARAVRQGTGHTQPSTKPARASQTHQIWRAGRATGGGARNLGRLGRAVVRPPVMGLGARSVHVGGKWRSESRRSPQAQVFPLFFFATGPSIFLWKQDGKVSAPARKSAQLALRVLDRASLWRLSVSSSEFITFPFVFSFVFILP